MALRKRKRPDWPIQVVKYRAYPREIPQAVWDTAKTQQALWNQLVTLANWTSEWARLIGNKKQGWSEFEQEVRRLVAASGLDWVNGPAVADRLRTAIRTRRWPRYHGGLDRICLSHRYTGGGTSLNAIVDNKRAERFTLLSNERWATRQERHTHAPLPLDDHWHFRFAVNDSTIEGAFNLHRPLPADAVLKQAAWVGERAGRKWYWYIILTVEQPPISSQVAGETHADTSFSDSRVGGETKCHLLPLAAGLDLGWRLIADGTRHDYLRVGMLYDSEGRQIELRLPLWLRPNRRQERFNLGLLAEWQQEASSYIQKGQALVGNKTLGRRGLFRSIEALDSDKQTELRELLNKNDMVYQRIADLRYRMIMRRRWYYQNIAQWLCRRYETIIVEDMNLQELHLRTDDPALQNAAQYRNYAAVGELRNALKVQAGKCGSQTGPSAISCGTIVEGETSKTTLLCWSCGAETPGQGELERTCPNGHRWDIDANAARNLLAQLSQIDGSQQQSHELRKLRMDESWKRLDIPERIRAVAVEVPAY